MKQLSMKPTKKEFFTYSLLILSGMLLGWILFGGSGSSSPESHPQSHDHGNHVAEVWTCSMHPAIREEVPGSCPICGMDLTPATASGVESDHTMVMTEAAMRLAQIQTTPVIAGFPVKEMTLPGRISVDERRISHITARQSGWLHHVQVNYTGAEIREGEVMASIYSRELISAQRELLDAYANRDRNPMLYEAAVRKFRLWEFSDEQIRQILNRGEVVTHLELLSPVSGTVLNRTAANGLYISEGSELYQVADLDRLWVTLEANEEDLPWIAVGDSAEFHTRSNPGVTYRAVIEYLDPVIHPETRTLRLRASISNSNGRLRPDMIVTGRLMATMSDQKLMIPASAVLWTGRRSLVYVQIDGSETPQFQAREVDLGPRAGDFYVIEEGLTEGELVVFHGAFRIDSEMQLADRFSMMNRQPGSGAVPVGHHHGSSGQSAGNQTGGHEPFQDVSPEFQNMLSHAVDAYLDGKDALVDSDLIAAQSGFLTFRRKLHEIGEHGLPGEGHQAWMQSWSILTDLAGTILQTDDIEEARTAFRQLSDELIKAVHLFGIEGVVYHQYCPMAFDWDGGNWLSSDEQIQNPYLPETMLMCGEVITRIE